MSQNWSRREGQFQCFESSMSFVREVPFDTFTSKTGERDDDVGIVGNELSIEISKTQERLYVLNLPRFRPISNCLHFSGIHL